MENQTENKYLYLKKSALHNNGLFAKKYIPKKTKVISYVGNKITKEEADKIADRDLHENKKDSSKGAVYLFILNKKYDVDGNVPWNLAKWINHSCDPNCEIKIKKGRIWIVAIKAIKKDEEITYNYGYSFDEDFEEHYCICGSEKCIGYILDEDDWPKLKEYIAKKTA